ARERPPGRWARTNELDAGKRWPMIGGGEEPSLLVVGLRGRVFGVRVRGVWAWRSGLTATIRPPARAGARTGASRARAGQSVRRARQRPAQGILRARPGPGDPSWSGHRVPSGARLLGRWFGWPGLRHR